jgi:hypothetical protein
MKTLADVINLKEIIEVVLRDYNIDEQKRIEIAQRIYEQYKNTVRTIATKYIETEAAKRSSLIGINNIVLGDKNARL